VCVFVPSPPPSSSSSQVSALNQTKADRSAVEAVTTRILGGEKEAVALKGRVGEVQQRVSGVGCRVSGVGSRVSGVECKGRVGEVWAVGMSATLKRQWG
jgi:hypothetical protein